MPFWRDDPKNELGWMGRAPWSSFWPSVLMVDVPAMSAETGSWLYNMPAKSALTYQKEWLPLHPG